MEGKDAKRPSLREGSIGRDTGAHDRPKRHQSAISGGAHGSASENESLESLSSAAHLASAKHSVRSSKKANVEKTLTNIAKLTISTSCVKLLLCFSDFHPEDGGQEHEGNRGQHGQQTPGRHNKYAQKAEAFAMQHASNARLMQAIDPWMSPEVPTKGAALFFHAFWHPIRTFAEPLLRFV